jgi:outer membrane protein
MFRITRTSATAALVGLASVISAGAFAKEGTWLISAGASVLDPKSDNLALGPVSTLHIDSVVRPTFDITYMIRDQWGVELFLSTFWRHDLEVRSPSGAARLGTIKLLPPTVSLQYHFNPEGRFRPYAGLGLNYTFLSDESPEALGVGNSIGPAAQLGFDVQVSKRLFVNVSARYIDIDGDARLGATSLGSVEVDPFIYGMHFGYKLDR